MAKIFNFPFFVEVERTMTLVKSNLFRYLVRKFVGAILTIFLIMTVSFLLIHAAPGDPVLYMVGSAPVSEEFIEMKRHELGLDRPLYVQYVDYMGRLFRLDFGYSYLQNTKVLDLILQRLPATILLLGVAYAIYSIAGILLGVATSARPGSKRGNAMMAIALLGYCMPGFWLGLMSLYIFGLTLGWFPISGMYTLGADLVGFAFVIDVLRHLILPASLLGFWVLALLFRITSQSMQETLQEDFITTARAKGLNEKIILFKHALKNSLRPIVTLLGVRAGMVLGGAVITETIFTWPGMGRLMYGATVSRDYPLLLGCFVFTSIGVIVANLLVDLVYAKIDPRVRY